MELDMENSQAAGSATVVFANNAKAWMDPKGGNK